MDCAASQLVSRMKLERLAFVVNGNTVVLPSVLLEYVSNFKAYQ